MSIITIDNLFKAPLDKAGLLYHDENIIKKYWPVRPGDVCFDIGFGPGTWTLYALAKGATTYSFDPKPYAHELLEEFMKLNSFKGNAYKFGLMDCYWIAPFGENSSFKHEGKAVANYLTTTLDRFCNGAPEAEGARIDRIDFMNLDVEATELEVIKGGRETIRKYAPQIVIEVHVGVSRDDLTKELSRLHSYEFISEGQFLIAKPKK